MDLQSVYIVGVGMTPFGRHEGQTSADLARTALAAALADAGIVPAQIEAAYFGNSTQGFLEGQLMIGGEIALRQAGLQRLPIFNVENACATGASAFSLAVTSIRAGETDIALAIGTERMNVPDKQKMMAVFDGGYDIANPAMLRDTLDALGGAVENVEGSRSVFMDIYAAMARAHMKTFGSTQMQLAKVASKNHAHATKNPFAFYQTAMTAEEVLAGRQLAFPLTVPMCAPVTDGAAAIIVCSSKALKQLRDTRPVRVLASVVGTGQERAILDYQHHITCTVARRAYHIAGVGPGDISVAEVHDATAFGEILNSEALGFFEFGQGGRAAEDGVTSLGGKLPLNPSGGLESKGHPLAASGLAQIVELASQLRGEAGPRQVADARLALAENGGGFLRGEEAVAAVTILEKMK